MSDHTPPEIHEIDTLEGFDALLSPQRLKLAEVLARPKTAKEAAGELGIPVTRLYYHLNRLLDLGLVRVVDERPKGAMKERIFQIAGSNMRPSKEFLDRYGPAGIAEVTTLSFRHAEARFADAARAGAIGIENDDLKTATIGLQTIKLSAERLHEFVQRIEALAQEFTGEDGELPVSIFYAAHIRKETS
jgi:DNA-binding transcriptional ArsR family regulator